MNESQSEAAAAERIQARSAEPSPEPTQEDDDSITSQDLEQRFMERQGEPEEEPTAEPTEEPGSEPGAEEGESSGEDLSQWVQGLSSDQRRELAIELGGGLGKELGKLRQDNRDLEKRLDRRAEFEPPSPKDNPYSAGNEKIETRERLEEGYENALETIRNGNRVLRRNPDAHPEETIYTVGEHQLTSAEVQDMVDRAEDARDRFLPARDKELKREESKAAEVEELEKLREGNLALVEAEYPWRKDEESPLRAQVDKAVSDYGPAIAKNFPDWIPWQDLMFSAFAEKMQELADRQSGTSSPAKKPKVIPKPHIPGNPSSNAAPSGRPEAGEVRATQAAEESFVASGSHKDYEQVLLARQRQKKHK